MKKLEKPKKEDYGYEEQGIAGEQGGWQVQFGKEAYEEALKIWEQENKPKEDE